MKALVTGGGGFLGGWVVKFLLKRGDSVRVLGRRRYPELHEQNVETVSCDIADRSKVHEACRGVDAVFHIAARVGIWGRKKDFLRTNVEGTENIISGCLKHGVKRLVYTSTPSVVYGKTPIENGNEGLSYPDRFLAVYPETKAIAERMVLKANGTGCLHTCALRPHLIWGPEDTNLIPRIVNLSRRGRLKQVGHGTNLISTIYVENAAAAHLRACDKLTEDSPVPGQAYFLVEPEPVNCWDFINRLLKTLDCPSVEKKVSLKTAYSAGVVFEVLYRLFGISKEPPMTRFLALQLGTSHYFDSTKIRRDLKWEPHVDLEEGLKRLINSR